MTDRGDRPASFRAVRRGRKLIGRDAGAEPSSGSSTRVAPRQVIAVDRSFGCRQSCTSFKEAANTAMASLTAESSNNRTPSVSGTVCTSTVTGNTSSSKKKEEPLRSIRSIARTRMPVRVRSRRGNRIISMPLSSSFNRGNAFILLLLLLGLTLLLLVSVPAAAATATAQAQAEEGGDERDFLTENSVVLITGAAGFIGSELAMALHRTYNPKRLLCIDSMVSGLGPNSSGRTTEAEWKDGGAASSSKNTLKARTEEELALFEFKRQRAFHVLQTVGEKACFFRSDFRPTIPEYFDTGEVPLLDTIFQSHPDITHVVHLADPYHSAIMNERGDGGGVGQTQAVPRTKDSTKSGMIEAILEQLRKVGEERGEEAVPHLVYASSFEAYNHAFPYGKSEAKNPNPPPFREDRNLTVPSTLRGTSKVIDEILATTYSRYHGIYSVGLRFFPVYGPWGLPGTPLFEMAERAVSDPSAPILLEGRTEASVRQGELLPDDIRDYVYIDDAVDAIMTAMQYRPRVKAENGSPPNLVINVGSGEGSTLRDIATIMEAHFPRSGTSTSTGTGTGIQGGSDSGGNGSDEDDDGTSAKRDKVEPTVSFASTYRAETLLGFKTQVSVKEGIANLLAWHFDRAFPYGGKPPTPGSVDGAEAAGGSPGGDDQNKVTGGHTISAHGIEACSPFDKECLTGAPVFPCASECSHESQCIKSYLDDATEVSRSVTAGCDAVLYTVHLGDHVVSIPSAHTAVSPGSTPYIEGNGKRCNVAFVSEGSALVRRLKREKGISQYLSVSEEFLRRVNGGDGRGAASVLLTNGFWTLVPVASPPRDSSVGPASFESSDGYDDWDLLRLLPKISPGLFFSGRTKYAIYADPDITFASIPDLLRQAKMQPYKEGMLGATASIIGSGPAEAERRRAKGRMAKAPGGQLPNGYRAHSEALQLRSYNMVRVGLEGEMQGGGDTPIADSSWIVHTLGVEDARLFRCDVMGEIVQWEAGSDERSLEFVMGLHDLWSRVIVTWGGVDPWWRGEGVGRVKVVPEAGGKSPSAVNPAKDEALPNRRRLMDVSSLMKHQDAVETAESRRRLEENDEGEATTSKEAKMEVDPGLWMGVLSSTEVHYFVRVLPSSAVGAVHLEEEYNKHSL